MPRGVWSRPVLHVRRALSAQHSHGAGNKSVTTGAARPRSVYRISARRTVAFTRFTPLTCGNATKLPPVCGFRRARASGCSLRTVEHCRKAWPGAGYTKGVTSMSEHGETDALAGRRNIADPRISIVIPALNEALNLAAVLPRLPEVHEVILVDGGSVDGTVQAARRALPGIVTVAAGPPRQGQRPGRRLRPGDRRHRGDVRRRRLRRPGRDRPVRRRAQGRRRLRQGLALHRRWRLGRHHDGPQLRQPVPQRDLQPRLPDPLHATSATATTPSGPT